MKKFKVFRSSGKGIEILDIILTKDITSAMKNYPADAGYQLLEKW